jgi:hypothetical protein
LRKDCNEAKVFFFVNKKEAKKTSLIWVCDVSMPVAQIRKSFLLLFYKKEALPSRRRDTRSGCRRAALVGRVDGRFKRVLCFQQVCVR